MCLHFDNHINKTEMELSCHIECRSKCILFESVLRYRFACYSRTIIIILWIYIALWSIYATEQWTVETNRATQSDENAFITCYTTPFGFCHKFNFVINELLITREQLFLHDRILSDCSVDISLVIEKKKKNIKPSKKALDIRGISCVWKVSRSIPQLFVVLWIIATTTLITTRVHFRNVLCVCLCEICWARFANYAVSITHIFVYAGAIY